MSFLVFYDHLTTHVVPGPRSVSYFVPVILLISALLIPPSILTHRQLAVLFLPLIYLFQFHAWFKMGGVDVISVDLVLWSFTLLACQDPRNTFKRIRVRAKSPAIAEKGGNNPSQNWEQPYPSNFLSRIHWVCSLLLSFRFTDWKIGSPSHDQTQPPKRMGRGAFLTNASFTVLSSYLLLDIACSYVQTDPFFAQRMAIDEPFSQHQSTASSAINVLKLLPPRLVRSSCLAAQIYASVTLAFALPTLPAVILNALGILPDEWSPQNWPVIFGPFSALTTKGLRGLWGSWWHQMNRQFTLSPARSINQVAGIANESSLGYANLVIVSFLFSGVQHMGLVPPRPLDTEISANEIRLYWAAFFWVQIPGFAIDIVISRLLENLALPRLVNKVLVLTWLVVWLSLSLPFLAVSFRGLGYWHVYPLPISPLQGLTGKQWLMW